MSMSLHVERAYGEPVFRERAAVGGAIMTIAEAAMCLLVSRSHIRKPLASGKIVEIFPKEPNGQVNIDAASVEMYRREQAAAIQVYQDSQAEDDEQPRALKVVSIDAHAEEHMVQANSFDLEIALQKLHELSMEDGDLGFEYWHHVGQLLRRAAGMQAEIESLTGELKRCRELLARSSG
jgi:hypothetical protein